MAAGEPLLNHLGEDKIDIIKTIGSLPASYTLNWLEEAIFNANREHLVETILSRLKTIRARTTPTPTISQPSPDGPVRYSTGLLGFSPNELENGRACQDS